MATTKDRITCYECGSSYSVDLGKIPEDRQYFKCLKCGKDVPILRRLIKPKSKVEPASLMAGSAPQAAKALPQSEAMDYSEYASEPSYYSEDESEQGNWLATFADMLSILLIFFILLFAISSVDKKKFETVMQSINNALGGDVKLVHVEQPAKTLLDPSKLLNDLRHSVRQEEDALSSLRKRLEAFIAEQQLQDKITLADEDDGLVLIAQDMTMFDSGSAEIREEVRGPLKKIASILQELKNNITVEGHTDDAPIRSARFSSNWELSVMRATNVIHYFVEECGLDASRLTAAGYAYYRPRYSFTSPDRGKNRRIEVKIRKKYSGELVDELMKSNPP